MNFIVFSDDWGRHPSSCEHIFRKLLDDHRIIWVNTIGYRSPKLNLYDIKRSFEKLASWFSPSKDDHIIAEHPNLLVISPIIIPYNNFKIVRLLNKWLMDRALNKAIKELNFGKYILLSSHPTVGDYYKSHNGMLKIYYCVDDFTVMPGVNNNLIAKLEQELAQRSDIIFYTAKALKDKFHNHPNSHYLPHGVDYDHFSNLKASHKLEEIKSPIIGFFGMLSEWVDLDLVKEVALSRPEWNFVFIGNKDIDLNRFLGIDNLIFMGPVPYPELPSVAQQFDIGMIPFKVNQLTKAVNPLKFLEYASLGLPVVSTELPELRQYEEFVLFVTDKESFITAAENLLSENSGEKKRNRIKLAYDNSWLSRSKTIVDIINHFPR